MPDDLPYGERCKTYTGMPVVGTRARTTNLDMATLHRQANDNLLMLPAVLRREADEREQERFQRYVDKLVRARLREDIRDAKADVRRVRCGCKDCRRYVRTVSAWVAKMQATLKKGN
jgi:hypothetical protein